MQLDKSQSKYQGGDSPPPIKRGKQLLYGSASMMLALMVGVAPHAVAKSTNGVIQFDKKEYKVDEMEGKVTLWVERKEGNKGSVAVMYGTTSGSAVAGFDYKPKMGHLEWGPDDKERKPIHIKIIPDPQKEKEKEEFFVTLLDMAPMGDQWMPKDGMPKDGMPKDGMPPDGTMPHDGGMMPPHPDGEMQPPPPDGGMMAPHPNGGMQHEWGNPTTVDFGNPFQAKVMIMDNKGTPKPPPGKPGDGKPGAGGPGAGEPGTGDQPPRPSRGEDGPPSVITPGEVDIGTGEQIQLGSLSTNIFSSNITNVVKSETSETGQIKIVHRVSISRSFKIVKKRKIKIKFKVRDGGDSELDEISEAFVAGLEAGLQGVFGDDDLEIEEISISSLGDMLVETDSGVSISIYANAPTASSYAAAGVYFDGGQPIVAFESAEGMMQSAVYPALATSIIEAIAEELDGTLEVSTTGSVTYLPADGESITVTPSFVVTQSDAGDLSVSGAPSGLVLEAQGLSQEVAVE